MKKLLLPVLAALALALAAEAGTVVRSLAIPVDGTNVVTRTQTVRGELGAIAITAPEDASATVSVASGGVTLFEKASIAASTVFRPLAASCDASGAAISNEYQRPLLGGKTTVTVTGTGTNLVTWGVDLIIQQ